MAVRGLQAAVHHNAGSRKLNSSLFQAESLDVGRAADGDQQVAAGDAFLGVTALNSQLNAARRLSRRLHAHARPDLDALADQSVDDDLGAFGVVIG